MILKRLERTLNYDFFEVFKIVINVTSYPLFVKWCMQTCVDSNFKNIPPSFQITEGLFYADLQFGYKIFNYKYTSAIKYIIEADGIKINISSHNGPFKTMHNNWTLTLLDKNKTKVDFYINFELKNKMLEIPAKLNIDHVSNTILDCFENELKNKKLKH